MMTEVGGDRGRGRPARPRRLAWLAAIAAAAVAQSGCQSSGCGGCGTLSGIGGAFSGFGSRVREATSRVFHHKDGGGGAVAGCDSCGEAGVVGAAPIEYGAAPGTVILPGPGAAPGGMIGAPVEVGPPKGQPADIQPAEPMSSEPGTSATPTASGLPGKAAYNKEVRPQKGLASAHLSPPKASSASRAAPRDAGSPSRASDLVIPEPPADLPAGVAGAPKQPLAPPAAATPPAPPVAEANPPAADGPAAVAASAGAASVAPGIAHFEAVALRISGGSLPTAEGLEWLAEKGYRTFIDLRDPSEITPGFMADVDSRGFRYIYRPLTLATLNQRSLDLFNAEIAADDARPVYFCDREGVRASTIWYLRRVLTERVDDATARREADAIAPPDPAWTAAAAKLVAAAKAAAQPLRAAEEVEPPAIAAPRLADSFPAPADPAPIVAAAAVPPAPADRPSAQAPAAPVVPQGAASWRPYAALAAAGLGIPLAYLSRSAISQNATRARASLPAAATTRALLTDSSGG